MLKTTSHNSTMDFQIDPAELHQFPDRLFRRELQNPANLRELIEELADRTSEELLTTWTPSFPRSAGGTGSIPSRSGTSGTHVNYPCLGSEALRHSWLSPASPPCEPGKCLDLHPASHRSLHDQPPPEFRSFYFDGVADDP